MNTKCLHLQLDNLINWKICIEEMIPKLSRACYAISSVVHISNINCLKSIYCAFFIIKCGIIFLGNFSKSGKIFTLQKTFVRIMAGAQMKNSCRSQFKQLEILLVPCQYIL